MNIIYLYSYNLKLSKNYESVNTKTLKERVTTESTDFIKKMILHDFSKIFLYATLNVSFKVEILI